MNNPSTINLEYGQPVVLNPIGEVIPGQVNRVILAKTEAIRVVYLALDAEAKLPVHPAPGDTIIQVVEGEIEFMLDGTAHRLRAGEAIAMKPGALHAVEAITPSKMMVTAITKA